MTDHGFEFSEVSEDDMVVITKDSDIDRLLKKQPREIFVRKDSPMHNAMKEAFGKKVDEVLNKDK